MKKYVLGFLIEPSFSHVLLIHTHAKNDTNFNNSKFNGIGSKVINNEFSKASMQSEFLKHTNLAIDSWTLACRIEQKGESYVYVYKAFTSYMELLFLNDLDCAFGTLKCVPILDIFKYRKSFASNLPLLLSSCMESKNPEIKISYS